MPSLTLLPAPVPSTLAPPSLLALIRAETSPKSLRTYALGWQHFAAWAGIASPEECSRQLLANGKPAAVRLVYRYRQAMVDSDTPPRSINVRLASLRYLVSTAERLGIVDWQLSVKSIPVRAFRDTRGPTREQWLAIRAACEEFTNTRTGKRDLAILRLLYDLGLRRGEVVKLNVKSYERDCKCLKVRGKGKHEDQLISVPAETVAALEAWLAVRPGELVGPMFVGLDRAHSAKPHRIDASTIERLVKFHASRAGVKTSPHGLRHSAITYVVKETNGNMNIGSTFARHEDKSTIKWYIDSWEDVAGKAAAMLAK